MRAFGTGTFDFKYKYKFLLKQVSNDKASAGHGPLKTGNVGLNVTAVVRTVDRSPEVKQTVLFL